MTNTFKNRILALLSSATLAAGLVSASAALSPAQATPAQASPAQASPAQASPAQASPSASASLGAAKAVPGCRAAQVTISYRYLEGAAGTTYGALRVKNVSGRTCSLRGYGGISYVGNGDGTQIGAASDREQGVVRTIVLRPGQRARTVVAESNAGKYPNRTCRPRPVDGFRIYLPNETRSKFVRHATVGCANPKVHLLRHQAYER